MTMPDSSLTGNILSTQVLFIYIIYPERWTYIYIWKNQLGVEYEAKIWPGPCHKYIYLRSDGRAIMGSISPGINASFAPLYIALYSAALFFYFSLFFFWARSTSSIQPAGMKLDEGPERPSSSTLRQRVEGRGPTAVYTVNQQQSGGRNRAATLNCLVKSNMRSLRTILNVHLLLAVYNSFEFN